MLDGAHKKREREREKRDEENFENGTVKILKKHDFFAFLLIIYLYIFLKTNLHKKVSFHYNSTS